MAEILSDALSRAIRINAIVRKEIKTLVSDKIAILILFIIPVVLIGVLGTSRPSASLYNVTVWVIDQDQSEKSAEFIATMKNSNQSEAMTVYASGELAPIEPELGEEDAKGEVSLELAEKTLPTQYLDAYIIILPGYADSLRENGSARVVIYYDAIDIKNRFIADAFILLGLTNVQLDNLIFERDVYYFPESRPNDILQEINILAIASPFFVGIVLFFSMQLVTTQAIVGDVPLKRLLNTSLRRGEVVSGKIIAYSIIAVFQIIITLLMLQAFDVEFQCLWIDLFLLLLFNSVTGIAMGIFISTISKTRLQASQLFLMFFFIMLIFMYYVRNEFLMPYMPLEQNSKAFASLAFRGASMGDVATEFYNIALTGLFYYIITLIYIRYFKKEFV